LGSLIQTNISHKVVPTSNIGCIASSDPEKYISFVKAFMTYCSFYIQLWFVSILIFKLLQNLWIAKRQ